MSPAGPFRLALILGGARSGKSRYALGLAEDFPPPRLYVATAESGDEEMAARIARHRRQRGEGWDTREEPLDLAGVLAQAEGFFNLILVDCLTLWLSNWLIRETSSADLRALCLELAATVEKAAIPTILVSNEVGWGIVPDNPLARDFRDWAGWLHQLLARLADRVELLVAGLPLTLKSPSRKEDFHGI